MWQIDLVMYSCVADERESLPWAIQVKETVGAESGRRSVSPTSPAHSHGSRDLLLNPDRVESEV